MKKFWILMMTIGLIMGCSLSTWAAADYRGEFTALGGDSAIGKLNLKLGSNFDLQTYFRDAGLRTGILWHPSDRFGIKAGIRYDVDEKESIGYGGLQFSFPMGSNLHFNGDFTHNYEGKDWDRYETYIKIGMYPSLSMDVGVMGNSGDGAPIYDYYKYNTDIDAAQLKKNAKEGSVFMRGNVNLQGKRFGLALHPTLFIQGAYFHDYDLTFKFSDQFSGIFNVSSLYDNDIHYRLGFQVKF